MTSSLHNCYGDSRNFKKGKKTNLYEHIFSHCGGQIWSFASKILLVNSVLKSVYSDRNGNRVWNKMVKLPNSVIGINASELAYFEKLITKSSNCNTVGKILLNRKVSSHEISNP
jgi:hypothetical protein